MNDRVGAALQALRAGHLEEAHAAAAQAWNAERDHRAAALLALLALERRDMRTAYEWTRAALAVRDDLAALHAQAGRVALALGLGREGVQHFADALRRDPALGHVRLDLAGAHAGAADWDAAMAAIAPALHDARWRDRAMQRLLELVPLGTDDFTWAEPEEAPALEATAPFLVSVVVCSVHPDRLARAERSYARAFGPWPWELVVIGDARSLAEGYTRGMHRAHGDVLVFSHDDVELGTVDLGRRLAAALSRGDVVGIAGAEQAGGPAWSHAGHPHLHGAVAYPADGGYEVHVYNLERSSPAGLQVLDGVFLALRAATARAIGWDAATFTGWHGYDLDFCLRAAIGGEVLHVAYDLALVHHSRGRYDDAWRVAAEHLRRKHSLPVQARGATHAYARRVDSINAYAQLMARWRALSRRLESARA